MMLILQISISIVIILVIAGIFSVIYKNKEKVDTGFELVYFKLSYRRKMIRTLWSFPIIIILLIVPYMTFDLNFYWKLMITVLLLVLNFIQLAYNYYQWKKHEKN